jgi:hypothetical protein
MESIYRMNAFKLNLLKSDAKLQEESVCCAFNSKECMKSDTLIGFYSQFSRGISVYGASNSLANIPDALDLKKAIYYGRIKGILEPWTS